MSIFTEEEAQKLATPILNYPMSVTDVAEILPYIGKLIGRGFDRDRIINLLNVKFLEIISK